MEKLLDKIVTNEPRERAGSRSYNRFDFQQNWALCKIFDLHSSLYDYLVCFDYYDDIIIMDSSSNPEKISFYQVKTRNNGQWTLKELLKTTNSKSGRILNSFLGKLYYNAIIFPENTESLNFISNISFNIKLENGTDATVKSKIVGNEIAKNVIDEINSALIKELELRNDSKFKDLAIFEVTQLSIEHHEELTKIKLADFLEKTFPNTPYQITPIYKSLFGELKRKAKYEKPIQNIEILKEHKSISKSDFDGFLKTCVLLKRESFQEKCSKIEDRLNTEHVSFHFIKKFRQKSISIEVEMMNKNNKLLNGIIEKIKLMVRKELTFESADGLLTSMNKVYEKFDQLKIKQKSYDEDYIKSLILIELYEN
jgi:hypothetical protein